MALARATAKQIIERFRIDSPDTLSHLEESLLGAWSSSSLYPHDGSRRPTDDGGDPAVSGLDQIRNNA